ncbi:hypothetical protein [Variovorax sp. GT1P44]|uniref:hypothetical protein n=1 Tax=Variovorax sp. GT1P44 TaxID=3443742 RepID=UPI003F468E87
MEKGKSRWEKLFWLIASVGSFLSTMAIALVTAEVRIEISGEGDTEVDMHVPLPPLPPFSLSAAEIGLIISALTLALALIKFLIAWRKERREAKAAELSMEKTRLEIETMRRDAEKE